MEEVAVAIIGGGVIGLSAAYELSKVTSDIIVLEKNETFGQDSSSRNSEVIHAGLYYEPGSLKAKTCIRGRQLLYDFCTTHSIPHKRIGKFMVACNDHEVTRLDEIYRNANICGVDNLRFLEKSEIKKLEPKIEVQKAFFSPDSGIIDSHSLMQFLYVHAKRKGVTFSFSTEVIDIKKKNSHYEIVVREPQGEPFSFKAAIVINAAGLYSDKVASTVGIDIDRCDYRLHYCKGQYFRIAHPNKFGIKHLIYPPSTRVSLGIHITPDLGEGLRLGPDAKYIEAIDYNVNENDKDTCYNSVVKFLPSLEIDDLIPDTAGVRPKLQAEDEDFRDFVIKEESDIGFSGFINLIGIESPGLTSCLAIAEIVKEKVQKLP